VFSISSNLRRVCWELTDPEQRLDEGEGGISVMSCFQPQLAYFPLHEFQKMVDRMGITEEDPEYWIEEKLDGERMQLHMQEDDSVPGGKRFGFWSRKAKDYTYLYGSNFQDESSALTRFIKDAFDPRVRNIILDGEMITWDPDSDMMVPFGTLKSAAIEQQKNPYSNGIRPLFRVFDCLLVNDQDITKFTLRDRHNALIGAVKDVHRRLEILRHVVATSVDAIEPLLRKVVQEASEGLVLKNPRSLYRLNSRNEDWMKVKPEYMNDYGESLDCLVLGAYYGSGHKGGRLSSFLCGLRVTKNMVDSRGKSADLWILPMF
jgi:DNA ligase-4